MKFFRIDMMRLIFLDVKFFPIFCLRIYYKELAVKTALTTMGHFFAMKLNYCPSDIICNSIALKMPVFEKLKTRDLDLLRVK